MNNDMDAQFLCKDCSRFNQCKYYDRRKGDSYICKYYHLTETYGMTNGDVIQTIYGVMVMTIKDGKVWVEKMYFPFDESWWNAPYKGRK